MNAAAERPRVLILGAGFGGLGAARKLKDADADVVIVDQHDFHTFQPMLYQVATAVIETTAVAHPVRDLFHDQANATVHQATARRSTWTSARSSSSRWSRSPTTIWSSASALA